MNRPRQVGITGGIGSGKTTVSRIFELLGIPVYNSDTRAHMLMNTDESIKTQIRVLFGEQSITSEGLPDRKYIAKRVFQSPHQLDQLNAIIHPAVAKDYLDWCEVNRESIYLIKEAALLIETGIYKQLDHLVVVSAPVELRKRRVLARDAHRTSEDVDAILTRQISEEERRATADFIIDNDESRSVIDQVLMLDKKIRQS